MRNAGFFLIFTLVALPSCSSGEFVTASGVVTLDGQPLAGAAVVFVPDRDRNHDATGISDDQGRFQLHSSGMEGAMPGKYAVSVTKAAYEATETDPMDMLSSPRAPTPEEMEESGERFSEAKKRFGIPRKNWRSETSELFIEIPPEGNGNIEIRLVAK